MQNTYNTGERIPREKIYDTDERLTAKHIHTLQFVQEVVRENKELKKKIEEYEEKQVHCEELHKLAEESKEKIKLIQQQYLARADEINVMMTQKHNLEMNHILEEKLEQEKNFTEEIAQMKGDILRLEQTNKELMSRMGSLGDAQDATEQMQVEIEDFKRRITDLKEEIEILKEENKTLMNQKLGQFSEIQELQNLKARNDSLTQEIREVNQKNTELKYKISKLEKDLIDSQSNGDHTDMIEILKNKLSRVHKERSMGTERIQELERLIEGLKGENKKIYEALQISEVAKKRVLEEYYHVHSELQMLKKQYMLDNRNQTFQEFVQLKREMKLLKEKNLELKQKLKLGGSINSLVSLPVLKHVEEQPPPLPPATQKIVRKKKKNGKQQETLVPVEKPLSD